MLEQQEILDDGQFSNQQGLDQLSISRLVKASGWINFLSIFFYLLGILSSLFFLYVLVLEGGRMRGDDLLGVLLIGVFISISFVIARQLQYLASATRKLGFGASSAKVSQVCASLKRVFMTFGVLTICSIALGLFAYLWMSSYNY